MKIMLDAGHDGHRNQSPVFKPYYESDFAWKLQNYLKEELEKYGVEVGTTRKSQDEVMDVVVRGKKAQGYDLFISIHSNACGTESVDRPVGIFLAKDGTGIDVESEKVANILATVVRNVMETVQAPKCYSKLAGYDRNGNGITTDDDYYGVLYGCHKVKVAGIILEHSFHTNKRSAEWLYDDNNVRKLAVEESKALAEYYNLTQSKPVEVVETTTETVVYKVQKGDTLSKIVDKYNTTVDEILTLNPIIQNKNTICVGWNLTIPVNSKVSYKKISTYTVVKGDSLIKIANKLKAQGYSVSWTEISKANNISFPYTLSVGQVLIVP